MRRRTRIFSMILALLLLLGMIPSAAFASSGEKVTKSNSISSKYYYWGGETIRYTFQYADGSSVTTSLGGFAIHYVGAGLTGVVGNKVAFCIEPNVASTNGDTYTGTDAANSAYWTNKLTAEQRRAIGLVLLYGAPNSLNSTDPDTAFGQQGATQILIWEIVMGLRSPTAPYTLKDARLKNNFYNNSYFPSTKTAYDAIVAKMQAHLTIPSFTSGTASAAPTVKLNYDAASGLYKGSVTDNNGVLASDCNFSATGVTFSKSGNTLNISAPASAFASGDVTASATGRSLSVSSLSQMIWTCPSKQTVMTFSASPDPVRVYFKLAVDTASLEIVKKSEDGNVANIAFTVKNSSGTTIFAGKTDSSGKLNVPGLMVGQTYTVIETVPQYYEAEAQTQTVTVKAGTNTVTFVNHPMGTLRMQKISDSGNVEGYCFKLYQWTANKSWYGKSDGTGKIYETDSTYTDGDTKTYTFRGLTDGTYTLLEVLSQYGRDNVWPESIRIMVANGGVYVYDKTFTEDAFTQDANGDCRLNKIPITGLSNGGMMSVTVKNRPVTTDLEIVKQSDDGNVAGISFEIEQYEPEEGTGWRMLETYQTDDDGKINIPNLKIGVKLRITEIVPENYISENRVQEITPQVGTNSVTFVNHPISRLELVKTSDDGKVDGIEFTIYQLTNGQPALLGSYTTDAEGKILIEDLTPGTMYHIVETVPEGYIGQTPTQTITAALGTNTVNFSNRMIRGSLKIVKRGMQTPLSGAGYRLFDSSGTQIAEKYTDENGEIVFENLAYGEYSYQEFAAPEGFVLDDTVYTFAICKDAEEIVREHENDVTDGSIQILKTDEDKHPLSSVTFRLEFSVNGGETWTPVQHRDGNDPVQAGYCTSEGLTNGELTTGADGKAEYTGLCIDTQLGTILYRLTEISAPDGYSLLAEPAFEGSLPFEGERDISVTVVNERAFELPKTGDHGVWRYTVFGILLMLIAASFLAASVMKRKKT